MHVQHDMIQALATQDAHIASLRTDITTTASRETLETYLVTIDENPQFPLNR